MDINNSIKPQSPSSFSNLTLPVTITFNNNTFKTFALIDSGASENFIQQKFIINNHIPTINHPPIYFKLANNTESSTNQITPDLSVSVNKSKFIFSKFRVIKNLAYPIILGISWLTQINPCISWNSKTLNF